MNVDLFYGNQVMDPTHCTEEENKKSKSLPSNLEEKVSRCATGLVWGGVCVCQERQIGLERD